MHQDASVEDYENCYSAALTLYVHTCIEKTMQILNGILAGHQIMSALTPAQQRCWAWPTFCLLDTILAKYTYLTPSIYTLGHQDWLDQRLYINQYKCSLHSGLRIGIMLEKLNKFVVVDYVYCKHVVLRMKIESWSIEAQRVSI